MQRSKSILSIALLTVLALSLALPIAKSSTAGPLTINIRLQAPHAAHTPAAPGFWWETAAGVWSQRNWGDTLPGPLYGTPHYHLKFPAIVLDSQGHYLLLRLDSAWTFTTAEKAVGHDQRVAQAPIPGQVAASTFSYWVEATVAAGGAITVEYGRAGPKIDLLRGKVIKSPDAALIAMRTGVADVSTGLIRTGDIETLTGDGHTVTYDAGFHMGHVGFNIRPLAQQHHADGSPRRPDTTIWPLADVAFRHALFHTYNQETIVASIYGYTVTPVQSLVPPAQGGWVNPSVPKHPYNPGTPFTHVAGTACGILWDAGYRFTDAGTTGVVDSPDYWTIGGVRMPQMALWSPTYETAPTSAEHAARFITDLGHIGLAGTVDNGHAGLEHEPAEFADYMDQVDAAEFDAYMVFWSLGRFPDHLYDMAHSSQICGPEPENKGLYNKPGINDPDIDAATLIIKTSLDHEAKLQAAYDAQELLYDETHPNAMGYLQLYSRIYFDAFNVDMLGIVKSPGYGADNGWTHMNMHWKPGSYGESQHTNPDGTHFINWIWGEDPERMNPCYASTVYAWDIITKTLDGLLDVDPYTHEDLTSMSSQMPTIVTVGDHMEITFYIRKDIFWQDGNPYTAHDAKFNWDFFRFNEIPRYTTTWMYIDHVDVIDDYTVKVTTTMTSQFLVYDIAGLAAYLPPNVWQAYNNTGLPNILAYNPSTDTNAAGMGPWFGTPMGAQTRLFGTGPFVFDFYDPVGATWEGHQFPGYFRITTDIQDQKAQMFHEVGDVNWDGEVWADDRGTMGAKYGKFIGDPLYLADADVNLDGVIDVIDLSLANFHYGEQREHPTP